jgi:Cdc6-like AAA superfamily ATPase
VSEKPEETQGEGRRTVSESSAGMPGRAPFETVEESVLTASVRDLPTSHDHLGFAPYVEAIAEFLTNESTEPPLTLSVEGDWGSGKSSFMRQLGTEINKKLSGAPIVEFNAWRHDKEEALWAAFALHFTRKLSRQLKPWWRRWWAHILLIYRRFNWQEGWVDVLRAFGIALVFIAAAVACLLLLLTKGFAWTEAFVDQVDTTRFWKDIIQAAIASGGIGGYVVIVVSVWRILTNLVGNPLAIDLKRYAKSPDYEGRVAFIEQFHEDFEHIVEVYAGQAKKVYVFIDDLDRCEVPKSAELMQALNLMLSQSARLIYILGMDREKVAAAYAAKDADLLPFLAPASTLLGTSLENSYDRVVGLEYGYAFVEKFVQLPFRVPQPTKDDVRHLLDSLETARTSVVGPPTEVQKEVRKRIKLGVAQDSETIRSIVLMVSQALDNNPRRILQFINLFRLRTFIACETALFDYNPENNALTLQQLGKFVAISLRWPLFLADLEWYPKLLADLEKYASESPKPLLESFVEKWPPETQARGESTLRHWTRQQDLLRLLRAGIILDDGGSVDRDKSLIYTLADINVEKLLQVSARTRPQAATPEPPSPPRTPPRTEESTLPPEEADKAPEKE